MSTLEQQFYNTSSRNSSRKNHSGVFSENNPYYAQLVAAEKGSANKSDVDALYERAVEWEADQANYEIQKADAAELRAEERSYNSPLQQLQRDRLAGINSDLPGGSAGSSSGGTSSQVPLPSMADQQGQTAFGSFEADRQAGIQGLSAGASLISSIASLGTGIVSSLSSLALLPSQISMGNTSADLASSLADDTKQMSKKQLSSMDIESSIQNLSFVNDLAGMIVPDASDDDINSILTASGVSSDLMPSYLSSIRQAHKNPNFGAYFAEGEKNKRALESYNQEFTSDFLSSFNQMERQIISRQKDYQLHVDNLRASVAEILDTSEYAQSVASSSQMGTLADISTSQTIISDNSLQRKLNAFDTTKLERDVQMFTEQLAIDAQEVKNIDAKIKEIRDNVVDRHGTLTAKEEATISMLSTKKTQISLLASDRLSDYYDIVQEVHRINYFHDAELYQGRIRPFNLTSKRDAVWAQYTFGDFVTGDASPKETGSLLIDAVTTAAKYVK